jgi:putative nucleotidyltransferase with HDIG domain
MLRYILGMDNNSTNKKRILIVEDDPRFREAINVILSTSGFEVKVVQTAKEACNIAVLESFDLIISDIRMPGMTGIELLHTLKNKIKTPIALMTGFAEISETKEAYEIGATDFLKKPFGKKDLLNLIDRILPRSESEKAEIRKPDCAADYCEVPIEEFVSGTDIKYNIFLKLGAENFVKIANSGENIPLDRIKIYKDKGVSYLYLKKEEFKKYVQFTKSLADIAKNSNAISRIKKISLTKHATELLLKQYFIEGVDERSFGTAIDLVKTSLDLVDKDNDAKTLIENLNNHSDHVFAHSTGVSLYSVMIAQNLSWKSESTLSKVSLGGLFHDIGKKDIDRDILDKSRFLHTAKESKTYESHVELGLQVLSRIPMMHSEILLIILHHHEKGNGYGFPNRLQADKIFPLAKVVGLADTFCNLVIQNPSCHGFPIHEALKRINTIYADQYNEEFIVALNTIFNFTP